MASDMLPVWLCAEQPQAHPSGKADASAASFVLALALHLPFSSRHARFSSTLSVPGCRQRVAVCNMFDVASDMKVIVIAAKHPFPKPFPPQHGMPGVTGVLCFSVLIGAKGEHIEPPRKANTILL